MRKKMFSQLTPEGIRYYLNQIKEIMVHPFSSLVERNEALEHVVRRLETFFPWSVERELLINEARGSIHQGLLDNVQNAYCST